MMIAKSADVRVNVPERGTPLQLAVERELNALPILRLFLESGAIAGSYKDAQQQW